MSHATDRRRVLDAMRSREWLRTQWIVRTVFDLWSTPLRNWKPDQAPPLRAALKSLEREGLVEQREVTEHRVGELGGRHVEFDIP